MKLIHTADWHVGVETYGTIDPKTGLSTRLHDFLTAIDYVIDHAIKHGVDAFLFAGDAFKVRDPNPTHQREFSKKIRTIATAGIPVFLCIGNHDTPLAWGRATSLDIYDALAIDNVWVSAKPEIVTIPTKSGKLQILTIPWLTRDAFASLGDTLNHLYSQLKPGIPTVTVAHADVAGAIYSSEQQVSITPTSQVIPPALFTHDAVDYVALGHIHKHQSLASKPAVVYAGSVERIDFGEEGEEKGFVEVTIHTRKKKREVSWRFRSIPTRPFTTITCKLGPETTDATGDILRTIHATPINNAILRMILHIDADFAGSIDTTAIRKACTPAAHLASITRVVAQKKRQRMAIDQSPIALSPLDALKEYFKAKGVKGRKRGQLIKAAEELLEK